MMQRPIRVILVDDEEPSRSALHSLLEQLQPSISIDIVGEASSVPEAVEQIAASQPDILFLDIQLGNDLSFSIFNELDFKKYQIIFVTAYSQYALEAFRFSACDYLLKPVDKDQLKEAIEKSVEKVEMSDRGSSLNVLLENLTAHQNKKIVLSTQEMMHVVQVEEILLCKSEHNYTRFVFASERNDLIISKTLKEYAELLSAQGFLRTHKSWLVNRSYVKGFDKRDGGCLLMSNDEKVPVASRKRDEVIASLNQ